MAGRRRLGRMDEGDFLQVLVSQNATLVVKASAAIFDLVPVLRVTSEV
jgi:hypothetical protein